MYGLKREASSAYRDQYIAGPMLMSVGTMSGFIRWSSTGNPVFKNFNSAHKNALEWLKQRGFNATKAGPNISKFTGNQNGLIQEGNIGFRIEFDGNNGAHINVFSGKDKGPHFIIDGLNEAGVNAILRQLFGCK